MSRYQVTTWFFRAVAVAALLFSLHALWWGFPEDEAQAWVYKGWLTIQAVGFTVWKCVVLLGDEA